MASNVVYIADFSTDKITISQPKVLESGAKQAYLNYNGSKLTLQSATNLSVPFGLAVYDKGGPAEYSIELSFRGHDTNPEIGQFLEKMVALDKFMIQQAIVNSKAWFKKNEMSEEVAKEFYAPCVRYGKDADGNPKPYPPTIKLKLRKMNSEFEAKFYDVKGNPYKGTPVEELMVKSVQVTALMDCAGVWFAGGRFGLTWRAKQVVIHRLPERIPEFKAFRLGNTSNDEVISTPKKTKIESDEIDDDEEFVAPPMKTSVIAAVMPSAMPSATMVDDEAEDVEPAAMPKKPILKKKPILAAKK